MKDEFLLEQILKENLTAKKVGKKMVYDTNTKRIRFTNEKDNPDNIRPIQSEDSVLGTDDDKRSYIVVSGDFIKENLTEEKPMTIHFLIMDDGSVLNSLPKAPSSNTVQGSIILTEKHDHMSAFQIIPSTDTVRVICRKVKNDDGLFLYVAEGYVYSHGKWEKSHVEIIPVREELFSRVKGLFETDVISGKKVGLFGMGSFGGFLASDLAKQGVQWLILIDPERLDVCNVSRHITSLSSIGR